MPKEVNYREVKAEKLTPLFKEIEIGHGQILPPHCWVESSDFYYCALLVGTNGAGEVRVAHSSPNVELYDIMAFRHFTFGFPPNVFREHLPQIYRTFAHIAKCDAQVPGIVYAYARHGRGYLWNDLELARDLVFEYPENTDLYTELGWNLDLLRSARFTHEPIDGSCKVPFHAVVGLQQFGEMRRLITSVTQPGKQLYRHVMDFSSVITKN
ncbi:MAG: hypothetical protein WC775_00550 [Patescibacteria group bacterium]|jgi:hypothetical protein